MIIGSQAFEPNHPIPQKYTCHGDNISPPLFFGEVPAGAKSLTLVMDDPDAAAGTFAHWLVWNLPPTLVELKENLPDNMLDGKTVMGCNSFNRLGYGGPCPRRGRGIVTFFVCTRLIRSSIWRRAAFMPRSTKLWAAIL